MNRTTWILPTIITALFGSIAVYASLKGRNLGRPPLIQEFDISKQHYLVIDDLEITEDRRYEFLLGFPFKDQAERARLVETVGRFNADNTNELGILLPLELTIRSKEDTEKIIYSRKLISKGTSSFSERYFFRHIDDIDLVIGKYTVTAELYPEISKFLIKNIAISVLYNVKTNPKSR